MVPDGSAVRRVWLWLISPIAGIDAREPTLMGMIGALIKAVQEGWHVG